MNAYTPRSYQTTCLDALQSARSHGEKKALVAMASGLGKTLTGAFDIQGYLKVNENGRVLVLCHSAAILGQTKETFKAIFGDEYSYGMYNGTEKATHRTDFLFANLQSVNLHSEEFEPDEFCYIIVDEAHHSPAETYRKAIKHFRPKFLLGMTATPDRMDNANLSEIFGKTVYEYNLVTAVNDGWLSKIDYRLELDELEKLEAILDSGEPISLSQLNRDLFIPKRDEEIVRLIRERSAEIEDPTMVIFCQTINHAEHFAKLMGDAVVIHSGLTNEEQAQRLEGFRTGNIKTVCTVDMLNEGIDIPRTDVIVFLRVTQSKIVFFQQLGRGLRIAEGKGKVLVLDFVATADRLDQVFNLEREFKSAAGSVKGASVHQHENFTLNIDTPRFRERKVDIIDLIERATAFRSCIIVDDEEMLALMRVKADGLKRTPTAKEVDADPSMPHSSVYARRFGSFNKALKCAGIQPNTFTGSSDEELLCLLRKKAESLSRTPNAREINSDPDMPSYSIYRLRFHSYSEALQKAGLQLNRKVSTNLSDEQMIELLQMKANELGRTPSATDIDTDARMPRYAAYQRRFGNIATAIDKAGLRHLWLSRSSEDMLEQLRQKAKALGRAPTVKEVDSDHDMPSVSAYASRFGKYSIAVKQAGLQPIGNTNRKQL